MCARLKDSWLLVPFSLKRYGYTATLPESLHRARKEALRCADDAQHKMRYVVQHTLKNRPEEMPGKRSPVYVCGDERCARYFRIEFVAVYASNTESSRSLERRKRYESTKQDERDSDENEIQHRYV